MSSITAALIVFACILAGMLAGALLRRFLPDHHVRDESRDIVKVGTGLIATLTAMVLGLLISSAKSSFDAANIGMAQTGAKIISLDRALAQYGPETKDARDLLRRTVASAVERVWPEDMTGQATLDPITAVAGIEGVQEKLRALSPQNEQQRSLQAQALQMINDSAMARWQLLEQEQIGLPLPFLVVLVGWLTILFASFSLLAPRNATVAVFLLLAALSVSAAIFLLLEMSHPMAGVMKVSSAPLLNVLAQIGR